MALRIFLLICVAAMVTSQALAEPPLPVGLGDTAEAKQVTEEPQSEPALPEGLGDLNSSTSPTDSDGLTQPSALPGWRLSGFIDTRIGARTREPIDQESFSLAETRLQLKAMRRWDGLTATLTADLVADAVAETHRPDLGTGEWFLDLREANLLWRATSWLDIKAGRQILTWGTGEYVFLNDLFPKDYKSFFIGRPDAYLKAPSDAVKISLFGDIANLDIVYTPQFDADRFADGTRLSIFNPFAQKITGDNAVLESDRPDRVFRNDEWAARAYRVFGTYEGALYVYDGYWKSPLGLSATEQALVFNRLRAYGASVRGPLAGGIANAEISAYDSADDRSGQDPLVPNSQVRFLLGYERELATDLTGAVQYYLERTSEYDALIQAAPFRAPRPDQTRHLWTGRIRKSLPSTHVTAMMFTAYSPNDQDGYVRANLSWNATDNLSVETGANILFGSDRVTAFGQLQDNSNLFVAVRYGF